MASQFLGLAFVHPFAQFHLPFIISVQFRVVTMLLPARETKALLQREVGSMCHRLATSRIRSPEFL